MRSLALALLVCGCGASLAEVRSEVKATTEALSACRDKARDAFYLQGKEESEALEIYTACKRKAGL